MLKKLLAGIIDSDLYIQVWESHIRVINIQTGIEVYEPPLIAFDKGEFDKDEKEAGTPRAFGADAKLLLSNPAYQVTNPFSHPRQLLANFQNAEKVLKHMVNNAAGKRVFTPSPRIVFQPMEKIEGGLTEVEIRAFKELCLGTGAREVIIYLGPPVSRQSFNFAELKAKGI